MTSVPSPGRPSSAVVTGGARGIGRAIAVKMVARGHQVVITDINGEAAAATAAEIGAVAGLQQDVSQEASHAQVAAEAARHGVLTAWFNNAGVGDDGTLRELSADQVRRVVEVNLLGTMWGMRAALEAFGEGGGDIVNTASLSGLGPVPGLSTYAATKAAVISLSLSVDAETPRNVRIHALCPDGVDTEMVEAMAHDGLAKALVYSGGGLLGVEVVAAAAVDLLGRRRVVRSVPGWRGALMRGVTMAPQAAGRGLRLFRADGQRQIRKAAK